MGETERPTHDDDRADVRATSASPRFATHFKVRHYEMDALGHVNNAVYLHYLEQAAYEHSAAAGFSDERTRELGGIWIVRRHEIEYLRPATAGDVLQVVTWAVAFKGARAAGRAASRWNCTPPSSARRWAMARIRDHAPRSPALSPPGASAVVAEIPRASYY